VCTGNMILSDIITTVSPCLLRHAQGFSESDFFERAKCLGGRSEWVVQGGDTIPNKVPHLLEAEFRIALQTGGRSATMTVSILPFRSKGGGANFFPRQSIEAHYRAEFLARG